MIKELECLKGKSIYASDKESKEIYILGLESINPEALYQEFERNFKHYLKFYCGKKIKVRELCQSHICGYSLTYRDKNVLLYLLLNETEIILKANNGIRGANKTLELTKETGRQILGELKVLCTKENAKIVIQKFLND